MSSCRPSKIRFAAATCLASVAIASVGATGASADFQKAPPGYPPIMSFLPCQAKLIYQPNHVGGVYVTNSTSSTIPQGSKLTTYLRIGGSTYPQTKTMLGNWAPGQQHLARTFIWQPNVQT